MQVLAQRLLYHVAVQAQGRAHILGGHRPWPHRAAGTEEAQVRARRRCTAIIHCAFPLLALSAYLDKQENQHQ